jgi:hypothetical protein
LHVHYTNFRARLLRPNTLRTSAAMPRQSEDFSTEFGLSSSHFLLKERSARGFLQHFSLERFLKEWHSTESNKSMEHDNPLLRGLFENSGALEFGLSIAIFAEHLSGIGRKYLGPDADSAELFCFYRTLQLNDLVLAQACAEGSSSAWDVLVQTYKPKLYAAALAITKDRDLARQLADSLFGELFGAARNGSRCKLLSFTGAARWRAGSKPIWRRPI